MEQKGLAFFGKIAAGVTHELRNVLAVINESSGLMSDLLAMAKDIPFPNRDRFLRSLSRIEAQVLRGVEITGEFNRFAHSVDNPVASIDLNEIVQRTVALAKRFAALKNIELQALSSGGPVVVLVSPFLLQMVLTCIVEAAIQHLPGGGAIVLGVDSARGRPAVNIDCGISGSGVCEFREAVAALDTWRDVIELGTQMDAVVEWDNEAGLSLSLPESVKTAGDTVK